MKSYVIPVLVIAFVMFGTFFMTKRHSDKQIEKLKIDNANLVGDKRYFETLVDFMSNSISMTFPSCAIVRGADTIFQIELSHLPNC
ncbi:MAG: hypothetical protein K2G02_09045 [Phocaeicola sp.]|nr:hypothetical protein [Phocaeicola sp.]